VRWAELDRRSEADLLISNAGGDVVDTMDRSSVPAAPGQGDVHSLDLVANHT
jgi:hypothetical protein